MEYNKERLKKCFFEFNGEYSYDFYIDIKNWNHMDMPAQIVEQVRVPGAHKDIFYSEGTFENKVIDIECYIDVRHDIKRKDIHIKRIKQWLNTGHNYQKLQFSDDEGYYEGLCVSNMLFKEVVEGLYETLISFSCNPYKLKTSKTYIFNNNDNKKVLNEGSIPSPLKIKVEYLDANNTTGFDIQVLKDNKLLYDFKCDAPETGTKYVEIDCEEMTAKAIKEDLSITSAVNIINSVEFPSIQPGYNNIKFISKSEGKSAPVLKIEYNEMDL